MKKRQVTGNVPFSDDGENGGDENANGLNDTEEKIIGLLSVDLVCGLEGGVDTAGKNATTENTGKIRKGAVVSTSSPNKSHCAASAYTQAWISKFASHGAPTGSSTLTKEAITVQTRKLCLQSSTERRSPEKCPSQESSKLRHLRSDYEKLEDKCEWLKDELVKTDRRYKY
ncbi:uncharacterized protein LOC135499129 isoform X1 [Lineus longissimus]|uniref:uncharacterized protein LOC135499129 isoform X1 n=1 Tax=Lineus longissimus TaxID=88925 RepID=UPI00315DC82D